MIGKHVTKARRDWHHWVDSDHGLAALLFFLVLYGFIIYPLAGENGKTDTLAASSFPSSCSSVCSPRHNTRGPAWAWWCWL